jgi:hypothetical protein
LEEDNFAQDRTARRLDGGAGTNHWGVYAGGVTVPHAGIIAGGDADHG